MFGTISALNKLLDKITALITTAGATLLQVSVRQAVYRDQKDIIPNDDGDEDFPLCDALYVPNGGDVCYLNEAGVQKTTTVLDGSILPVSATRVFATNTSSGTEVGLQAFYYEIQS